LKILLLPKQGLGFKSRSEDIEIVTSILSLVGLSRVSQLVYKNMLAMADVQETYVPGSISCVVSHYIHPVSFHSLVSISS
jgi:hypothetical protein